MLRITPANWRSREQMSAEIDLLHHLYGHDISVPQPVQQMDGTYIQTLNAPEGPRHAVLFTFVPGAAPDATEEASHRYGQAIARFHAATDSYPTDRAGFRFEPVDMVDKPLARLRPFFADHEDDYDYLLAISTKLKRAADTLARNAPAYGVCHGDVNASNFHLDDGEGWALFDFEYFGYGWRIFDIGTFQHWVFELCMPFIREWIEDPW